MSTNFAWLIQEISDVQFTPVRLREGYEMAGVDRLLDQMTAALRSEQPIDELVSNARFTPVRMREGYDMGEVDRFLERIVSAAAEAEHTPPAYIDAPDTSASPSPEPPASVRPLPSVIQEQRGLWSRLFGRG